MRRTVVVALAVLALLTLLAAGEADARGRYRGRGFYRPHRGGAVTSVRIGGPSFFFSSYAPGFSFAVGTSSWGLHRPGRPSYGRPFRWGHRPGRHFYPRPHRFGRRHHYGGGVHITAYGGGYAYYPPYGYPPYSRYDDPFYTDGRGAVGLPMTRVWVPGGMTSSGYARGYWEYRQIEVRR